MGDVVSLRQFSLKRRLDAQLTRVRRDFSEVRGNLACVVSMLEPAEDTLADIVRLFDEASRDLSATIGFCAACQDGLAAEDLESMVRIRDELARNLEQRRL